MKGWPGDASKEVTTFGKLSRTELMSRVRSKGNSTTEIRMLKLLRQSRMRGWRRHLPLPGNPDFAWRKEKVVVFVDGCFWHGHDCDRNLIPKKNPDAWRRKIARTIERDRQNAEELRSRGWEVIRIWECELAKDPGQCLRTITQALRKRRMT